MRLKRYLRSSIGKKQILGVSGLLLCLFLVSHLLGNLLILKGAESYNNYCYALMHNPLILPAEIGLLLLFLSHIGLALRLTIENKLARPQQYHLKVRTGRGATFASNTMPYTGMLILVFLVVHMIQFRFGPHYKVVYGNIEMRDIYKVVVEVFQNPLMVIYYIFSVMALGLHVSHGLPSAFQSLGFNHPEYTPLLKKLGIVYALIMVVGFSLLPIWVFMRGGQI